MNDSIAARRNKRLTRVQKFGPLVILIALFIIISVISPSIVSKSSIMNILKQCSVFGILAIGETYVIMSGGIDLSVSAVCCFTACIVAFINVSLGVNPILAIVIGLVLALAVGALNGFLTIVIGIPDFIATLGTQTILNGLALFITGGFSITGMSEYITNMGAKSGLGVGFPYASLCFFIVFAIGWFLQEKTTLGRNFLAIGGNREAARVSGVKVVRTKITANMISAIFAGFGGIVLLGRLVSANALMGAGYETQAIACVVLGGTSINGGRGKMHGTLIGILILAIINTGMDMAGFNAAIQKIITGCVIVAVLTEDCILRKKLGEN